MKLYIILMILFISSCSKDEDMVTFEISVVDFNTGKSITTGTVELSWQYKGAFRFGFPNYGEHFKRTISIDNDVNTLSFELEFSEIDNGYSIIYIDSLGRYPGNKVIGCANISDVEDYTCKVGENLYSIEVQVFQ